MYEEWINAKQIMKSSAERHTNLNVHIILHKITQQSTF